MPGSQGEGSKGWKEWMGWERVSLEVNEGFPELGLVTLRRGEKLNAVDLTMVEDLSRCLDFLDRAFDCRVVILCGEGRLFCAGTDLATSTGEGESPDWTRFPDRVKSFWQMQHELSRIILKVRRIPQPVIAAVHGAAVGVGMGLANASDIVVASRGTRFINAFIKIGVSGADCGSSYFLPRILGFHRSAELLYSGRDFGAEEAHEWGYVNILVDEHEEVVPRAVSFAAEYMLTRSPLGLRLTKEALNYNMDAGGLEAAVKFEDRNQVLSGQTEDAAEGVAAFFEKRRPRYGPR